MLGGLFLSVLFGLTLTGFEPWVRFVDHVNTALATHNAAIAMAAFE